MSRLLEIRPDLSEGVDRKTLKLLRGRFLTLNAIRLERASQALSTRQQSVLRLLPLLFHVNHPLLPGYVSGATPCGLSGYQPDEAILSEAQRLTRSFVYKPKRHDGRPAPGEIFSLFLMGSLGTVAQAEQSDMDLWVCHDPQLSEEKLAELRRKCSLLEVWAASQGAELHCFLIDPKRYTEGAREAQLTSDDCGTTQHYLLLEEFYRTALWLGGRTPLWWLVPVYEEANYREFGRILQHKRFIRSDEVIDLGHLAQIPPHEFLGAGMWQLFKGIDSPFKSVLKLLLTEVYASEHPHTRCLALRFKEAVYLGKLDNEELDPYMMVFRRLEEYLQARGEQERLELVRRCLYLKIGKRLSRPPKHRQKSWQRLLLERLVNDWQWPERQLLHLDGRSEWKVPQVQNERRALVNELTYSYRFLSRLGRQLHIANPLSERDLGVLGRRLYAAFERKSDKVEFINPGIAPDLSEELLTLVQGLDDQGERLWTLYPGSVTGQDGIGFRPLKRARHLSELLAWGQRNGVVDGGSKINLQAEGSDLSDFELANLIGSFQHSFPLPLPELSEAALLAPSQPREVLILVNVGIDPLRQHSQQNVHLTTERTDSLGYSGLRDNLVLSLDLIALNSWNELSVNHYEGPNALLDCLCDYLNSLPNAQATPSLKVRCFCRNRAPAIAKRVSELFAEVSAQLAAGPSRYLLQVQQRYHLLDLRLGQVSYRSPGDIPTLLNRLGEEQNRFSPLHLDRHALEGEDLALILGRSSPGTVQLFYRQDGQMAELSILDEHHALWRTRLPFYNERSFLLPWLRFLNSIQVRQGALRPLGSALPGPAACYEVQPPLPARAQRLESRSLSDDGGQLAYYPVQALISDGELGQSTLSLFCNHREFSQLEYGHELFSAAARYILSQRQEGQRYPCYLTDLDLPSRNGQPVPTLHYLKRKAELEEKLNAALNQL